MLAQACGEFFSLCQFVTQYIGHETELWINVSIVNNITIKTLLTALLLVMLSTLSSTASAHRLGEGYVFINIGENGVHGEITITLRDLDRVLSLDIDGNGVISDEEVSRGRDRVFDYVAENVTISEAGGENVLRLGDLSLQSLDVGRFASISYESEFLDARRDIVVRYSMIFEAAPSHRGFLVLQSNAVTGETWEGEGEEVLIFTPGGQERVLPVEGVSAWTGFGDFLIHGVWHIWIGLDHILFLVALVLPSVLVRNGNGWQPVAGIRSTFWKVVKIVTLFTIAHTITLTLATMSLIELPSRLVESVIAASVAFAALNNVYPILQRGIGYVVFAFGLFHGFGFASVLQDLIISPKTMVLDLLAFNLGVEIGQVAIVALIVPILFAIRNQRYYIPLVLKSGSVLIGGLAILWLAERSLDLQPLV